MKLVAGEEEPRLLGRAPRGARGLKLDLRLNSFENGGVAPRAGRVD